MRHSLFGLLALLALPAAAAEDPFRVIKLEQDVRNLEREVQGLSRQLDELQQQLTRAGGRRPVGERASTAAAPAGAATWLDASAWERVRIGMSELEVIGLLGPPTSMRQEGGRRLLLYAMEIGSSGFLSGSVALQERAVAEVHKPVLK